jgi:hypothetical protein
MTNEAILCKTPIFLEILTGRLCGKKEIWFLNKSYIFGAIVSILLNIEMNAKRTSIVKIHLEN